MTIGVRRFVPFLFLIAIAFASTGCKPIRIAGSMRNWAAPAYPASSGPEDQTWRVEAARHDLYASHVASSER